MEVGPLPEACPTPSSSLLLHPSVDAAPLSAPLIPVGMQAASASSIQQKLAAHFRSQPHHMPPLDPAVDPFVAGPHLGMLLLRQQVHHQVLDMGGLVDPQINQRAQHLQVGAMYCVTSCQITSAVSTPLLLHFSAPHGTPPHPTPPQPTPSHPTPDHMTPHHANPRHTYSPIRFFCTRVYRKKKKLHDLQHTPSVPVATLGDNGHEYTATPPVDHSHGSGLFKYPAKRLTHKCPGHPNRGPLYMGLHAAGTLPSELDPALLTQLRGHFGGGAALAPH